MDEKLRTLLGNSSQPNPSVLRLVKKHQMIDDEVDAMGRRAYLTPEEEQKLKVLKHTKLRIAEQLSSLVKAA